MRRQLQWALLISLLLIVFSILSGGSFAAGYYAGYLRAWDELLQREIFTAPTK